MLISSDKKTDTRSMAAMLEAYEHPAILVSTDYQILATNNRYQQEFGEINSSAKPKCFEVSHGYSVPCDQAGEDCPLKRAQSSLSKERVLHIHQTPRGKEHVDVELLPILDEQGELLFFVELLKSVPLTSGKAENIEMVGQSPPFNRMLEKIARVGESDASVLLLGESGTGKELAARAIHMASRRSNKPLVTLECAGLTDTLFESELFGHVKGAFTGAISNRKGLVELADGGTLFLDELGDIPLSMQIKLLRLLESGSFRPVGSSEAKSSDFRLICATHRDLWTMMMEGEFRRDLYYRINVFPIQLPALSERAEDIPLLVRMMLGRSQSGRSFHVTDTAMKTLQRHQYTGNIRELRNLVTRATVLADTNVIDARIINECLAEDDLLQSSHRALGDLQSENDNLVDLKTAEHQYFQRLMAAFDGDKQKVADIAGISLRSLYRKLESLGDAPHHDSEKRGH